MTLLLSIAGISKAYPGVVANDDVNFQISTGEIHALLGENGAGKSTLVKMIYGLVRPDSGTMELEGVAFQPAEPRAARASGVAMVFQHFSLFEALSVAENIALGMENPPPQRQLAAEIRQVSHNYGLPLDPDRLVGDLSAGERQRVEIIRCLLQDPKLLIMDEPTSVLTPQEVEVLFKTLRQLAREGTAILYISHKLEEIRSLCGQATILRRGKVVDSCIPAEKTARELAEMMVGVSLQQPKKAGDGQKTTEILTVRNLRMPPASEFGVALRDIHFSLNSGEILGIAGVAGNGQDELLLALSGEHCTQAGHVLFQGQEIGHLSINQRRGLGIVSAPEERLGHAAAPDMSLVENAYLSGATRQGLARAGLINWRGCTDFADQIIQAFDVRTPSAQTAARALSGGNLQKFVIGREVLQNPKVLVVNQPTWGVDAAAAAAIRQALLDLAADGTAVLVISQDLDELLEISDCFAALCEGKLSPIRPTQGLSVETIGLMMGGMQAEDVDAQI